MAELREARYIGPVQASYDLLKHPLHDQDPTVQPLNYHLPNQQPVYFDETQNANQVIALMEAAKSQLMVFFDYHATNTKDIKHYCIEFPRYFIWKAANRVWAPRQRGTAYSSWQKV